jgi:hypothetical protein
MEKEFYVRNVHYGP